MLQSIKRALRVDPENGALHMNIVSFVTEGGQLYMHMHTSLYWEYILHTHTTLTHTHS